MTTATRNLFISGAALTSAAAIMMAAPAVLPGQVAGVPTPMKLSSAQYELSAISLQGINDALVNGWGGTIGASDPYYGGTFNNDVKATGLAGAAYYLVDNTIGPLIPFHLDNYFFEVGAQSGNPVLGGLGAVAYVGVGSIFGANSLPAQVVKAVTGGGTGDLGTAIMNLTAALPIVGDLTHVYFTGTTAGGTTDYGTGFTGVLAYANAMLPGLAQYGGVTGVISAVAGFFDGIFGGSHGNGGSHHSESDSEDQQGGSPDNQGDDSNEGSHHHQWNASAASVVAAKTAVTANATAVTANAATAVASGKAKPAAAAATGGTDAVADTPDVTPDVTPEVTGSDNSAVDAPAPKHSASRGQAKSADTGVSSGHESKRTKVSRAS